MEKEIIEFICGLILTAVIPVVAIRQLQKEAVFSELFEVSKRLIYGITIISLLVLSLFHQNSDIVMGTIIGCALFQILGICGVSKLNEVDSQQARELPVVSLRNFLESWKKKNSIFGKNILQKRNSRSSQYLMFCAILLLFLSADYLLRGESVDNILNQIDGGLLIFLFCTYIYLIYSKRIDSKLQITGMENPGKNEEISSKYNRIQYTKICKSIFYFLFLSIIIIFGNYFLFESVPKFGIEFEITQYNMGLTLMTWCVNLSGILLTCIGRKVSSELSESKISMERQNAQKKENETEKVIENVIFLITALLGGIVLVNPIIITTRMICDLIFFGVVSLALQIMQRIDNRIAGCSMATIYIGFVIYTLMY